MTGSGTAKGSGGPSPLISVIVPVYNAERFLECAVESALEAHESLEVVLSEDCSQDGSLAVCQRLAAGNARVRLLPNEERINRGAGGARNVGIRASRGKYIAFLDADDYYLPNRFEVDVPMLEADPRIDGVYGAVLRVREEGHAPLFREDDDLRTTRERIPPQELFEALVVRDRGSFHTAGITVRREALERAGLFPEDLPLAQDMALWLKLAGTSAIVAGSIKEPIAVYRRHATNRATSLNPYWPHAVRRYRCSALSWAEECPLDRARLRILREALADDVVRCSARRGRRGLRRIPAALYHLALTCRVHPCVLPVFCRRVLRHLAGKPNRKFWRGLQDPQGERDGDR